MKLKHRIYALTFLSTLVIVIYRNDLYLEDRNTIKMDVTQDHNISQRNITQEGGESPLCTRSQWPCNITAETLLSSVRIYYCLLLKSLYYFFFY